MSVDSISGNPAAQALQQIAQTPAIAKTQSAEEANESAAVKAEEAAKTAAKSKAAPGLGQNVDVEA